MGCRAAASSAASALGSTCCEVAPSVGPWYPLRSLGPTSVLEPSFLHCTPIQPAPSTARGASASFGQGAQLQRVLQWPCTAAGSSQRAHLLSQDIVSVRHR